MADKKKLPDYIVTERVKAAHKPYPGEVFEERIKAGSPESDDALRAASGSHPTEEKAPAKKSASAKK